MWHNEIAANLYKHPWQIRNFFLGCISILSKKQQRLGHIIMVLDIKWMSNSCDVALQIEM